MLWVSLMEVMSESLHSFEDAHVEGARAHVFAGGCFFAGCTVVFLLGLLVDKIWAANSKNGGGKMPGLDR
jgi:hypothetical protein